MLLKPRIPKRKGHHRIYIVSVRNTENGVTQVFEAKSKQAALKFINDAEQGGAYDLIFTDKVISFEDYVLTFGTMPRGYVSHIINDKLEVRLTDYRTGK